MDAEIIERRKIMKMEDWVEALEGIKNNKVVKIPYQLQREGQINSIIESLGGELATFQYFQKVL